MTRPFTKLSAAGNDFILFDYTKSLPPDYSAALLKNICHRQKGVGADGVLILEPSQKTHFRMRYFNADGREAEMCGNGARASAYFAVTHQLAPRECQFEVSEEVYEASVEGETVSLLLRNPDGLQLKPGALEHESFEEGGFCWVGVPHYALFTKNAATVAVEKIGKYYCEHPFFSPHRTNVNFIEIIDRNTLKIRTFERGVDAETLACGTGAVAAAYMAKTLRSLVFPLTVQARGGKLVIFLDGKTGRPRLQGEVSMPFRGEVFV